MDTLAEETLTGSEFFNVAKDGSVAFGAKAADAIATKNFNIGANIALRLNDTDINAALAASVDGADSLNNQAKIEITKNGALYLGIYLYKNYLYVNDGTALRRYGFTGDGSTLAPDLAGKISDAVVAFEGSGASVYEQFNESFGNFTSSELFNNLLDLIGGYKTAEGVYAVSDLLGSIFENADKFGGFKGFTGAFDLAGIDLHDYDDIFKTLFGYSYTEIEKGGFSKAATPFASLGIGIQQDDDGAIEKIWLSRTLDDSVISFTLSDICVESGWKNIIDAEEMEKATPGAFHIKAQSYIGDLPVYTDIKIAIDLNDLTNNKIVIEGGSSEGSDDYFTIAYDASAIIPIMKGQDTDGDGVLDTFGNNINSTRGNITLVMSPEFVYITGIGERLGVPEPTPEFAVSMGIYFPAFDIQDLIDTVVPLIQGLLGGEESETPSTGEEVVEGNESTFNILDLLDRLIFDGGIGVKLDQGYINDLANLDLWDTISEILPIVSTISNVKNLSLDNFVTKLIGVYFEGKTAEEIADDHSLDLIFSLPDGEAFEIGLDIGLFDITRPEEGELCHSSFSIGFCDEPIIDEKYVSYSVGVIASNKDPVVIDPALYGDEMQFAQSVVSTNNQVSMVTHKGNGSYYISLITVLLFVMQYGGFI